MNKKIVTSTLLSAGLLATPSTALAMLPSSGGLDAFFFFNDVRHQANTDQLLRRFFDNANNIHQHNPMRLQQQREIQELPREIQELSRRYRELVDGSLDQLLRDYTRNFSLNVRDAQGQHHVYIFRNRSDLMNIARRICVLKNMADPLATYILNFINGSVTTVDADDLAHYSRLCEQIITTLNAIADEVKTIADTQGLAKPTPDDLLNGRCVETDLMQ